MRGIFTFERLVGQFTFPFFRPALGSTLARKYVDRKHISANPNGPTLNLTLTL